MSALGEHLSQERLSGSAMAVLKELEVWLETRAFKRQRDNLYCCEHEPALFDIVVRLTKELHHGRSCALCWESEVHIRRPDPSLCPDPQPAALNRFLLSPQLLATKDLEVEIFS